MKRTINPGTEKRTLFCHDDICFSHTTDLRGEPLELRMSIQTVMNWPENRRGEDPDETSVRGVLPVLIWINGGGWRGGHRNIQAPEMAYFAQRGYASVCIDYRSSGQAKFPAQIEDVKTAVRFLKAHAEQYHLDAGRIAVMGRSAGGHLAAMAAMNDEDFVTGEWSEQSSRVHAAVDMFGPVDLVMLHDINRELAAKPGYRWSDVMETHEGALLGGDPATLRERCQAASPAYRIRETMCPLLILHGDKDPLVPFAVSQDFYERLQAAGLGDRVELVTVKNAGHGTREFFQTSTKKWILRFLNRALKVDS